MLRIKKKNSECSISYYAIHSHQLASKGMLSDFSSILYDVITIVKFIKSRLLRAKIFSIICKDKGSLSCYLLLHTSVRGVKKNWTVIIKILIQPILIIYKLSPLKYSPSKSIHFCIQSCYARKHLVKSSSLSLFSSLVTEALISSRDKKYTSFITAFSLGKSQKSQGAKSGE